jgi:hypothetical protein
MPAQLLDLMAARREKLRRERIEHERLPVVLTAHPGAVQFVVASESGEDAQELWISVPQILRLAHELLQAGAAADRLGAP